MTEEEMVMILKHQQIIIDRLSRKIQKLKKEKNMIHNYKNYNQKKDNNWKELKKWLKNEIDELNKLAGIYKSDRLRQMVCTYRTVQIKIQELECDDNE